MESIQTHPSNAAQAKAFTAPGSLSFPGATNELTPPVDGAQKPIPNGQQNGNGVTPATPAATPGANQGPQWNHSHAAEHCGHRQSRLSARPEDDCSACQECRVQP
uniref:Uncharacterized protein n=1 Tax=Bionectria ochroleuca TaxID=29856 RepID=A0A8H7TSD1_BIOOC